MAGHEKVSLSLRPDTIRRVRDLAGVYGVKVSAMADELLADALDAAESVAAATKNPVVMAAVTQAMSQPGVLRSMMDAMRSTLTDDQLDLFAGPAVKLSPAVLKREGVTPARKKRKGKKR